MKADNISGYVYESGEHNCSHDYILASILRLLDDLQPRSRAARSLGSIKTCLKLAAVMEVLRRWSHHMAGT